MYRLARNYHIGDFCVRREVRSKDGSPAESGEYMAIRTVMAEKVIRICSICSEL